jgi:hypothetical protein
MVTIPRVRSKHENVTICVHSCVSVVLVALLIRSSLSPGHRLREQTIQLQKIGCAVIL